MPIKYHLNYREKESRKDDTHVTYSQMVWIYYQPQKELFSNNNRKEFQKSCTQMRSNAVTLLFLYFTIQKALSLFSI